ncbi:MAG TPA: MFS transporter [Gaiellaceae bacterium]|nr:MFS transporter [Gaiellaceae bacterium]
MPRRLPPVLRQRDYALLWSSMLVTAVGTQMVAVAVGWQVYGIAHDPFDLGLIGLAEFAPLPLLALPAGHLADRLPRKLVVSVALALETAVPALLVVVSLAGASSLWPYLALAFATGVASAFSTPAARALFPELVQPDLLASALALRSIAGQAAVVGGPALGGVLFAVRPELVYGVATALFAAGLACALALRPARATSAAEQPAPGLARLLAGIGFIRRTPVILGAISLDLFAVLFGGAVALLPVFAQSVLHTGPAGLGVLRSAPAAGALVAGVLIARRPLRGGAGRTLLAVVAVFGASMVVFGLSRWLPLSLAALAVSGFADMISMNIRSTTVALATPDAVRGRVLAVEMVFVSASNELGAFESGAAAALLGAVPAVVAGGALTVAIAALWARLFPPLARVDRLEELRPPFVTEPELR